MNFLFLCDVISSTTPTNMEHYESVDFQKYIK